MKSNRVTQFFGRNIINVFGQKVAYYCKYLIDKKALERALRERNPNQENQKLQKTTKIAILFLGTNKFVEFLPKYYHTVKKYFLPGIPKDFFVFTDQVDYPFLKDKKDIVLVPVEHQKWPFSTLMRFKLMNKAAKKLKKYSHIIYIDSDMYVGSLVSKEDFFSHNKPLFGVQHDGYLTKPGEHELNPRSTAGVNKNEDLTNYYVGSFWGGKSDDVLKLLKDLEKRIDTDLKNKIIAKWHDESQINKYFIERKDSVYTHDPSYSYPKLKPIPKPYKKKVIHDLHSPIKRKTLNRYLPGTKQ